MKRRLRFPLLAALAAILLPRAASAASDPGDYFYSSGARHALRRIPGLWAVHSPPGAAAAGARDGWARRGVLFVSAPDAASAARRALSPSARPRFVAPVYDYGGGEPLVATDEFVASLSPSLGDEEIARIHERHGSVPVAAIPGQPGTFLLRARGGDAVRAAQSYVESGDAVFAHPDFLARKQLRAVPDDPYFPFQWHLSSSGQNGAAPGQDVDAPAAWDVTRGSPEAVVAVIDDGVDFSHEDLPPERFVPGRDFYDGDDDPSAEEDNDDWHGTAVTGAAAAAGWNGMGVTGLAPGCRVMPVRLVAGPTTDTQDAAAIHWAAENGAWIISNSWGPPDGNPIFPGDETVYPLPDVVRGALDYAAGEGRGGKGCVIVWAGGNGNEPVGYDGYASYGKVLAVGACNDQGIRAYYSDYGPELDLCAPSDGGRTSGICTTDFTGVGGYNPGGPLFGDPAGNYASDFGGTSSAAPLAAAAAALLLSREPELTRREAMDRLCATADRTDPRGGSYGPDGHSDLYGSGRVNACSALTGRTRHPRLALSPAVQSVGRGKIPSLQFELSSGRDAGQNAGAAFLVIVPPSGPAVFVGEGYRLSSRSAPFIPRVVASDAAGMLGPPVPLPSVPSGRYLVYGALVREGGDPLDPGSWLHTPASAAIDILP